MIKLYRRYFFTFILLGCALVGALEVDAQCSITNLNSSYCVDDASFTFRHISLVIFFLAQESRIVCVTKAY